MKHLLTLLFTLALVSTSVFAKPDTPNATIAKAHNVTIVNSTTAHEKYKNGAIFVDTRKVPEYAIEHIEGSISAFYDEKGGNANKIVNFDNSNDIYYDTRISPSKEQSLIFYCNGIKCWKSYKAAVITANKGYSNVYWLQEGIGAYKKAGYTVDGINIVAKIDTRAKKNDFIFHVTLGVSVAIVLGIILFFVFKYIIMKKAYQISTKLLSNIFIIVLSMSIIGFFSLNSSQDGQDAMKNIYENNFKPQNELLQAINNFNSIQNNLSNSLTGLIAFEGARVALVDTRAEMKKTIKKVMESHFYKNDAIKKSFDVIINEYQSSTPLLDTLEKAYTKEDTTTLKKLASNQWALSSAIINKQFNLIDQKVKMEIKNIYEESSLNLKKTFYDVLTLIVFFIFVSAALNSILYIFIKSSILGIKNNMESMLNTLDLSREFVDYKRDELGEVYKSFAHLIEKVGEVLHDAKDSSQNNSKNTLDMKNSATAISEAASQEFELVNTTKHMSDEMKEKLQITSGNVEKTQQETAQAQEILEELQDNVIQIVQQIQENAHREEDISDKLNQLTSDAQKISDVLGIIEDIADKTNLLALNAAIEAARAGEHGRGFAVVADEVRKLAESTQKAIGEIHANVSVIIQAIMDASTSMNDNVERTRLLTDDSELMREKLEATTSIITSTAELANSSLTSTSDVQQNAELVLQNIERIDNIVKQNKDNASNIEKSSNEVYEVSQTLKAQLDKFRT